MNRTGDSRRTPLELQLRLEAILDSAMDAVLVAEADGRIVIFNAKAERTFRCRASDAIGQPLARFVERIDTDKRAQTVFPYDPADDGGRVTPALLLARRADGKTFLADAVICRTELAGRAECSITLRDTSDQLRTQDMLRKLSSAVAHTADAVYVTDRNGVIEYVNPAFAAMMGATADEVLGHRPNVFQSGEHDREFYQRFWSTLLSGEVYQGVLVDKTRDGRTIHLDQTITPLKDENGAVTDFVAVGRDITSRVETEEALRGLSQTLEQQAREIAEALHDEAGQMLTSAYIAIAQAKRELPTAAHDHLLTIKHHIEEIEGQLRRLAHELRPRVVEDLGLLPALEFLAEGVTQRSGIAVSVEGSPATALRPLVQATIYRFAQEALSNARRHAEASHVTIRLEHQGRWLYCTVTDDGAGFDPAVAAGSASGHCMGLSTIRGRVAVLGGTFRIDSAPGRGTQASIRIPVETPPESEPGPRANG